MRLHVHGVALSRSQQMINVDVFESAVSKLAEGSFLSPARLNLPQEIFHLGVGQEAHQGFATLSSQGYGE